MSAAQFGQLTSADLVLKINRFLFNKSSTLHPKGVLTAVSCIEHEQFLIFPSAWPNFSPKLGNSPASANRSWVFKPENAEHTPAPPPPHTPVAFLIIETSRPAYILYLSLYCSVFGFSIILERWQPHEIFKFWMMSSRHVDCTVK